MSVFKDDQTTYTGNLTVLGSLSVGGNLVVTGTATVGGGSVVAATPIANSLGANVAMNNIANYFLGPTVAQGSTGTWFASGTVTVADTGGAATIYCKLWDGTTVMDSAVLSLSATSSGDPISLSGFIAAPAGNISISCRDITNATGLILANTSGNSKDLTLTAVRIG